MEDTRCRSCGSKRLNILSKFSGFPTGAQAFYLTREEALSDRSINLNLLQCTDCSLIQIDAEPVSYYREVITAASIGEVAAKSLWSEWSFFLENYLEPGAKVLEVGAGRGDFVDLLNRWGLEAKGLEYKPPVGSEATIYEGYFPDTKLGDLYDAVICNNFLEHHPTPKIFLSSIFDHLVNGGYLYLSVPRFEYLFDKACFYELIPDHLSYFTRKSLHGLVENSGFDILESYTKNNNNDHVVFCRKRGQIRVDDKLSEFKSILSALDFFFTGQYGEGKSVAVWGAGHRTLTLLSMIEARGVKAIVDSAPFKQSHFTPVTGIPVISPEEFLNNPTHTLLLMLPGKYAEQVASFLSECKEVPSTYLFNDTRNIEKLF